MGPLQIENVSRGQQVSKMRLSLFLKGWHGYLEIRKKISNVYGKDIPEKEEEWFPQKKFEALFYSVGLPGELSGNKIKVLKVKCNDHWLRFEHLF